MIHASGTLGPFGQLVDNLPVEIDLEASSGSTRLGIEGTIARPLLGQGLDFGITLASASLAEGVNEYTSPVAGVGIAGRVRAPRGHGMARRGTDDIDRATHRHRPRPCHNRS